MNLIFAIALMMTAPDAAELTKLLNDFLDGASKNSAAMHDRFWAEDLIYTGSAGRRVSKADIMKDVRASTEPSKTVYTAEDVRINQYGDTAIVAFRLVGTTGKEVANYLNSGTFLKRDGKWQVVNWQATRMPKPEEKKELIGNRFTIRYRSGLTVEASYPDSNRLTWKALEGPSKGATGTENASITEVAPGVFLVSWIEKDGITVTNALNLNTNNVTSVVTVPGTEGRQLLSDVGTIERLP